MKMTKSFLIRPTLRGLVLALAVTALSSHVARATPYASMISNTGGGTMQFYLNEDGADVTIKYEDNSTDPNYDGITTGVNLAAGPYAFTLGSHTSYSITVSKAGAGAPSLIKESVAFTPRGIAVNSRPASPYFGRIYAVRVSSPNGLYAFNPDFSVAVGNSTAGLTLNDGNAYDPYRISVAEDDYVMAGDAAWTGSPAPGDGNLNDGVYRIDPTLTTSQLFLGPQGYTAGLNANVHTTIGSRPVVLGNVQAGGPVTLLDVDADASYWPANSLLVYKNITLAALPWQNPPDIVGPAIGLNLASRTLGGNSYPGLQAVGNYIYAGTYRLNFSNPCLQIYTNDIGNGDTLAQVWDSITSIGGTIGSGGGPDLFLRTNGTIVNATIDIDVSPDGRYVAGLSIRNWFVIMPLTNGLPDSRTPDIGVVESVRFFSH